MTTIAPALWSRPLWMRLAALSAGCAILVVMVGPERARLPAQLQFMHAMATFACATFMNIGGLGARLAPALFLLGTLLFCGAAYLWAFGGVDVRPFLQPVGGAAFVGGWATLVWAAGSVDRL